MVKAVSNVWLPVNDMQRALGFYGDTLGITVKESYDEWSILELDGVTIGLNARESEQPGGEDALKHAGDPGRGGLEAHRRDP